MKTRFFSSLLVFGLSVLAWGVPARAQSNAQPAQAVPPVQTAPAAAASFPELTDLREQLGVIQRANKEASEKWEALVQQNTALSNVLTGLQETLQTQKEREVETAKQASAFNLRVIAGACAAVFAILLLSYWFQLRCLNRVMEFSQTLPAPPHGPVLLENDNSQASKLLAAMKLLENRIEHLEVPSDAIPSPGHSSNGVSTEAAVTHTASSNNFLTSGSGEPAAVPPSSVSLLLGKGQMLLDMERLQEAVNCFQEALALEPSNAEAHFKKGIALERMNRLEPALAAYEEALRLNPRRAIAHAYKARVLAALHRYDEAISVYDSALGKSAPKSAPAMFAS